MQLDKPDLRHLCTHTHEGKVILMGTVLEENVARLYYTIKQDGFEDSALQNPNSSGWEAFKPLNLPDDNAGDPSVTAQEQAEFTDRQGNLLLHSIYNSVDLTADAPAQLVSHDGYLCVFRQSTRGTLLVDRFVLDGMTNTLAPRLEVRFKRSRQRYKPQKDMKITSGGQQESVDSLDFRDILANPFHEPTLEICPHLLNGLHDGWFGVVITPTLEQDSYRWHIFAHDSQSGKIDLLTLHAGDDCVFDLQDDWFRTVDPITEATQYNSIPGITNRTLTLQTGAGQALTPSQGLTVTLYDVQREQQTQGGPQLVREASKVLLAVPTAAGIATLSFALAADGRLAQIARNARSVELRSDEKEILLPVDLLDNIRPVGDSTEVPTGTIAGMSRSDDDDSADRVRIQVSKADKAALGKLRRGDTVKLSNTTRYNGLYQVINAGDGSFVINATFTYGEIGEWEKVEEEESGLIFDGMLTGYEKTADGKLKVTAVNHGLAAGDLVQIVGDGEYSGEFPVLKHDDDSFVVNRLWANGTAVNIKLVSRKRRGLVLDGKRDWISAPFSQAINLSNGFTVEAWVKLSGNADQTILMMQPELPPADKPVDAASATAATLALKEGKFTLSVTRPLLGRTSALRIASDTPASLGEWVHVACSFNGRQLHLLENGVIKASVNAEELDRKARVAQDAVVRQLEQDVAGMQTGPAASEARSLLDALKVRLKQIPPALNLRVSTFNIGAAPQLKAGTWQPADLLQGQLSDVRLWTMGCDDKAILNAMHLQLTGRETGLSGHWRLGGIAVDEDGSQRVFDFSVNANHGRVRGAPYAGGVVLDRTLRDGKTEAVKFSNIDLFAVREGAIYVERFEFRADKPVDATNADGKKKPIFAPSLWGQLSRTSEEKQTFDPMQKDFEFDRLGDGWQSATCRFLIPEGVRLLRSFEVTDVTGDWSTLEVRKHTLKLVSDTVTLSTLDETARLTTLTESLTTPAARQQALVNRLLSVERAAQQESEHAETDPLNYACTFTPKYNPQVRMEGVQAGDVIWQAGANQQDTQRWTFQPLAFEDDWLRILNQQTGKCLAIMDDSADKAVHQEDYADGDNQKWLPELLDDGHVKVTNKRYGTVLEAHKTVVGIITQSWHGGDTQRWKLTPEGAVINDRITPTKIWLDNIRQQRVNAEAELARLNALPAPDPREQLVELAAKENEEAAAVTRQKELERLLADVADIQKRRETEQRRNEQQRLVERLRNDESAAQRVSDEAGSDPFNFWCTLTTRQNGGLRLDGATDGNIYQNDPKNNDQQRWKFEPLGNGWFKVINKKSGKCADVDPDGHGIHQVDYFGNNNQQWRIEHLDDGYLKIVNRRFDQEVFDAMTARKGDGFIAHGWHGGPNQRWKLAIDGEAINNKPADARNALEEARRQRANAEAELVRLNTALNANDSQRAAWEQDLKEIQSKLGGIHLRIAELTTAYLNLVAQVNRTALDMPALTDQKDPRGLQVQGALLSFAHPAGRLHAMESCTGRVTISYLDVAGNLRQTHYDTAYDADGKGEEWLPDTDRAALALDGRGMALSLPAGVFGVLSSQITVEFWARGGSDLPRATFFLAAQDTDNKRCLSIQLPNEKGEVVWEAGQPASGAVDSLVKVADAGDYRGRWTHWAFVKDAEKGEMRIYLNGKLWVKNNPRATEGDLPRSQVLSGIGQAALGGIPGRTGSWQGQVCELRIWNVALGEREIETNSVLTLSGNEPGLVAYYPFNEGQGDLGREHTGAGQHIATGGAAWSACTAPIGRVAGVPITLLHQPMSFDGARDFVQLPPLNLDFRNGFTIEARVKYNSFKSWSRIVDLGVGQGQHNILLANQGTSKRLALQVFNDEDKSTELVATKDLPAQYSIHLAATVAPDGMARLYIDGEQVAGGKVSLPAAMLRSSSYIGKSNWSADGLFDGQMDFVRLHASALSAETVGQLARSGSPGSAVVCAEYSRVRVDAQRRKTIMMMRSLALPAPAGVQLLDEQRIEALEMNWIGNAQINPTLIGYIEGPPPLPSENLTEEQDYNGATSVELIQSSDVEYSWTREDDVSLGAELEVLAGVNSETSAGALIMTSVEEVKSGFGAKMDFAYHWQNASTVGASHSLMKSDRLELRGSQESEAHFLHLGRRFIPKNIGYALVSSGVADVFVSKLKRSGRMIGYQVLPVEGVPVDVNTVTFLINPAYTMSGSLDGLTGSRATSDRFFQHVPEMRNQYGSLYPASYFRIKEAYDLKNQIDQQDKTHEAYFNQFNAHLVDEASLNRQAGSASDNADVQLNSPDRWDDDKVLSEQIKTRESELEKLKNARPVDQAAVDAKQKEVDNLRNQETERKSKDQSKRKAAAADRQNQIDAAYTDHSARANATESFSSWQKKMETLLIRAGKRNIVNTYVWDGDGGFHTEEQQFASTVEHSIGGSFDFAAALGGQGSFAFTKVLVELSAYARMNLTQTMSKTERGSKGMELHVDLSGVESRGITDYRDYPIMPGEKVDRYRFMSFFLENSSDHWHDFFNTVVDPEWLASNDEEARALRQAQSAQPNKVWRVLHRVTYVERPALIGFGHAVVRKGEAVDDIRALREQLNDLQGKVEKMHTEINNLLGQLLTKMK